MSDALYEPMARRRDFSTGDWGQQVEFNCF
jgi:hypothetical protein